MTTATEALFTPVQYFTALDPYNWQVDNRPLSDLEANEVILSEGVETALHAGKLNSSALGVLIRALCGSSTSMTGKITLSGIALNLTIEYSVFTSKKATYLGENSIHLVAVQPDAVSFALTAPAAGYKNLYTISVRYQDPNEDLPYFDPALPLDPTQIATGTLEYSIASNTALLVGGTYPPPPPYFWEVIQIEVLSTDVSINPGKVTYPYQYFIPEGQAFNYASQTRQGQVLFATPTEVTTGTNTTKAVTPADLKNRIDAIPQATDDTFGIVQFADSAEVIAGTSTNRVVTPADLKDRIDAISAGDFVTTTDGIKHGINANLRSSPNSITSTDLNTVRDSGTYYVDTSCTNKPPFCGNGVMYCDGNNGGDVGATGSSFWLQRFINDADGRTFSRRISGTTYNSNITVFPKWTEAFTKYRTVVQTAPAGPTTTLYLTADDFSSHTMVLCDTRGGGTLDIIIPVATYPDLVDGQVIHIKWFAGTNPPTLKNDPLSPLNPYLSPLSGYALRTPGSTASIVYTSNFGGIFMIIGEMP